MHTSIRKFLQVATARGPIPKSNVREIEDIAGEMHAAIQNRIDTGDEAAGLLLGMLTQLVHTDKETAAARLAAVAAAEATKREALKRKGIEAGLPARGDAAMAAD